MPVEVTADPVRGWIAQTLSAARPRVWLATPFMSFAIAQWLTTLPAAGNGDRRLLVAWNKRSLDSHFLSASGVQALRISGFQVRDLPNLHAKVVVAGNRAYFGSGNLTSFGLDGRNAEISALLNGRLTEDVAHAFEQWWGAATPIDSKPIAAAIKRQDKLAHARGHGLDDEIEPGRPPTRPPRPFPPAFPPDPRPAPAAEPPAIVHFWRSDTIAFNIGMAGHRHDHFESTAPMAGRLAPGTRVYTVGWAPMGGLLLINRFTVDKVSTRRGECRVSGRDASKVRFDRVIDGDRYARTVRIRNQRQAPTHHMAFSPMAYLSQRTATAFDRLINR